MAYPSLRDDGSTVTLDLHGARVAEALDLVHRTISFAAQRGRHSVKIIHGSSTTHRGGNATIKSTLSDLIDTNSLHSAITNTWATEDFIVLSLPIPQKTDPTPLNILDLQRRY